MSDTVTINSFTELIDYLRTSDLDSKQTEQVISQGLRVWFIGPHTKETLIQSLVDYWDEWGNKKERPLFVDLIDPLAK